MDAKRDCVEDMEITPADDRNFGRGLTQTSNNFNFEEQLSEEICEQGNLSPMQRALKKYRKHSFSKTVTNIPNMLLGASPLFDGLKERDKLNDSCNFRKIYDDGRVKNRKQYRSEKSKSAFSNLTFSFHSQSNEQDQVSQSASFSSTNAAATSNEQASSSSSFVAQTRSSDVVPSPATNERSKRRVCRQLLENAPKKKRNMELERKRKMLRQEESMSDDIGVLPTKRKLVI